MAKLRHVAFFTPNPERLANFYVEVFGMTIVQKYSNPNGSGAAWVTDGYMDIALINPADNPDLPMGINHVGITIEESEKTAVYEAMTRLGLQVIKGPTDRPYVEDAARDPDGNKFDISVAGLRAKGTVYNKERVKA